MRSKKPTFSEMFDNLYKGKRVYWAVIDRKSKAPLTLYNRKADARSAAHSLNSPSCYTPFWSGCRRDNPRFWVKRYVLHFKGAAVDIYEHQYERYEKNKSRR